MKEKANQLRRIVDRMNERDKEKEKKIQFQQIVCMFVKRKIQMDKSYRDTHNNNIYYEHLWHKTNNKFKSSTGEMICIYGNSS